MIVGGAQNSSNLQHHTRALRLEWDGPCREQPCREQPRGGHGSRAAISGATRLVDTMMANVSAAPRVSVLIPTFRQVEFVDKAIESALKQTFGAFEVVVVDDHSPDDTERVCAAWRHDPRFRYVRNERNIGRVANYQRALYELARGDWVVMLDGDDYLSDPEFLSTGWHLTQRYADEGIAFVQAGHVCRRRDGLGPDVVILPGIDEEHRLLCGAEYLKLVYTTGFFSHLGIFYNRRIAIDNDCYSAPIRSSDMESFLRIALGHHVVLLNTTVGYWMRHENNTSLRLPACEIAENVQIFRAIAELAIRRRLLARSEIEAALSQHEARTLAYLCAAVVTRDGVRLATLLDIARATLAVNPRATFYTRFLGLMLRGALPQLGAQVRR